MWTARQDRLRLLARVMSFPTLSLSQSAAVAAPWSLDRATLIVATAGSGKTLALAHRAIRIALDLHESGARGRSVLCVTFAKAACEDLVRRVDALVDAMGIGDSIAVSRYGAPFGRVAVIVKTINGVGNFVLQPGVASEAERRDYLGLEGRGGARVGIVEAAVRRRLIAEAVQGAGVALPQGEEPAAKKARSAKVRDYRRKFERHHVAVMDAGNAAASAVAKEALSGKDADAYARFVALKKAANVIDFSDQIGFALALMRHCPRIRDMLHNRFAHVLCDEGQDLGATDLALLRELAPSCTIVGDGDQEIFGFKSGLVSWYALDEARRMWKDVDVLQLAENRRCPPAVVSLSSAVVRANGGLKKVVALRKSGKAVVIVGAANFEVEVEYVCAKIQSLVLDDRYDYSSFVVLSRRNRSLSAFRKAMAKFDPTIPLARKSSSRKRAKNGGGALCDEVLDFLSLLLPSTGLEATAARVSVLCGLSAADAEEAMTSVASRGDQESNSQMKSVRQWHIEHKAVSRFGRLLREFEKVAALVKAGSSLATVVQGAGEAIRRLGIGDGDDEIPAQAGDALSRSLSQESLANEDDDNGTDSSDLLRAILEVSEKMDKEALLVRDDAAYLNCRNKDTLAHSSANLGELEVQEEDDDDLDDFMSLVNNDLKSQQTVKRKQKGLVDHGARLPPSRPRSAPEKGAFASSGSGPPSPAERLDLLDAFVSRAKNVISTAVAADKSGVDASSKPAVEIKTIHKAKGGEWPFVFVVDCTNDNLPVEGDSGHCTEAHTAAERRVFFVASTRAKEQLFMTFSRPGLARFASRAEIYQSASPFFSEGLRGLALREEEKREEFVEMTHICGAAKKDAGAGNAQRPSQAGKVTSSARQNPKLRAGSVGSSSRLKKPRTA